MIWNDSEIFVNWLDTHGENGYRIDVSTDGVNYQFNHTVVANSTGANLGGLRPGQLYWIKVTPTSFLGDGVPAVITSQTRLGTRAGVGVRTVDNLRFANRESTSITIAWDDLGVEDGYRVERSTDGVNWTFLGDAARNVTTWTESNLTPGAEYYYRVLPFNQFGAGAWSMILGATPAVSLPAGWASQDVGAVFGPGAGVNTGPGAWNLISGGGDVFGTADAFHFTYQALSGNATIVARVDAVESSNNAAKAGLIIRQDLTAGSPSVALTLNAGGGFGIDLRTRTAANAGTAYQQVLPNVAAPYWLRLTRSGGTITASTSADGTTFTEAATIDLALSGTFYVGMAVTSSNSTQLNTSTFSNVIVDAAGVTVTPTSGLVTTEAGSAAAFTVVLNSQPTADVSIAVCQQQQH